MRFLPWLLALIFLIQNGHAVSMPIIDREIPPPKFTATVACQKIVDYCNTSHAFKRFFISSLDYGTPKELGYTPRHNFATVDKIDEASWFITLTDLHSTMTCMFRLYDSGRIVIVSQIAT